MIYLKFFKENFTRRKKRENYHEEEKKKTFTMMRRWIYRKWDNDLNYEDYSQQTKNTLQVVEIKGMIKRYRHNFENKIDDQT